MANRIIGGASLQVPVELAKRIGLESSMMVQQIHYLMQKPRFGTYDNGVKWIKMSAINWQEHDNFPFWSEDFIQRLLVGMKRQRFIFVRNDLSFMRYDRTKWYTVNYAMIEAALGPELYAKLRNQFRKTAESKP